MTTTPPAERRRFGFERLARQNDETPVLPMGHFLPMLLAHHSLALDG